MAITITGKTDEQVLAESTSVAQKAAQMIGGTFEQGQFVNGQLLGGFVPITSENITPASSTPFVSPTTQPITMAEPVVLSPIQQEAQTLIDEIRKLNLDTPGKEKRDKLKLGEKSN